MTSAVEPLVQRVPDGLLDRLEERERHRPELDLQPEGHAARRGRVDHVDGLGDGRRLQMIVKTHKAQKIRRAAIGPADQTY